MSESTEGSPETFDVGIVGLGPVGAFCALLLAEEGLRVVVFERETEPVVLPRAVGLDGESVRAFQRIGLGEAVDAILQPPRERDVVCFTNSKREQLFGIDMPRRGASGWRQMAFFDQPELEALLREQASKHERIEVRLGHAVEAVEQKGDRVRVRGNGPQGVFSASASYLIGCDGASSFVRRDAGFAWLSLGYDQDWLVVDIVQGPEADLPLVTMQVCDPERLTSYICVKDPNRRWEFQLLEGETREQMLAPERIESLLLPWLPPEHYEIRRAAVYQFHAATAEHWQEGRVLLAGDAAHQTPPFLGQGLNTGLRDAVNLGWKLPLVHAGRCEAQLLETYAAERDAHARELVEWAVAIGKLMETLAAREAGLPDPHASTDSSAGYGQGRSVPPLRGGVLLDEQSGGDHPVGIQMAQPTVDPKKSGMNRCRIDELLGRGFAIVGRTESDLQLGPEAARVMRRLGARALSLEGLEVVEGAVDRLFERYPAVVIRPDRYIFGVVDGPWSLDALLLELARKLALRSVPEGG